jgi:hypothetical protein
MAEVHCEGVDPRRSPNDCSLETARRHCLAGVSKGFKAKKAILRKATKILAGFAQPGVSPKAVMR